MKRKIMAVTLTAAMLAGLAAVPVWADDTGSDEGKVLNIYCWNEEFKSRLTDHYPGYEEVDGTHGKIGDVDVVWNITPSDDNAYQNNLDETLLKQADASADDKIDLFLVEADYALKYVNTDYTMPVADLGITEDEVADQYQYTKDVMTDADGNLKGLSWQGCPGTMIYRRDIAKEVFGTDDPAEVQKKVADWDTFKATAEELKEKGYQMTSTVNDSYRVFSNNVSTPWVVKDGGWAATEGPQGFYWGGTWITAATGTDNPTLVADIMKTMTTNVDVMKEIVTADNDFVNNKPAMEEMAKDESYGDAVLGGQNPLAMFCAGADKIDLSNMSIYDQGCNEEFQNAMKNYFEGNASYDEALDLFYKAVVEKYPELSY